MKKKAVALLASLACAVVTATAAQATTIDFDTLPDGSPLATHSVLSTQYSSLGVTFSGYENGVAVPTYVDTYWGSSPAGGNYWSNGLPDNADQWGTQRMDVLRVEFAGLADKVGFDFFNSHGYNPITFNFYGTGGNLLGSQQSLSSGWQTLSFSYEDVSYFEMLQPEDSWFFDVDNLTYSLGDSAPVPEPSTVVLLGAGLAGAAVLRRRKKEQSA